MIVASQSTDNPNEWVCEISDFGPGFRLTEDIDLPLNGEIVHWVYAGRDEDGEGDIRFWLYREYNGLRRLKIFND